MGANWTSIFNTTTQPRIIEFAKCSWKRYDVFTELLMCQRLQRFTYYADDMEQEQLEEISVNFTRAAELAGVTRQTIIAWEKSGKLSVNREEPRKPMIEVAELMRATSGELPGIFLGFGP